MGKNEFYGEKNTVKYFYTRSIIIIMYKYVIFSHRTLISHSGVLTYMYTDEVWELEFLIYDFIYLKFKTVFCL